MIKDERVLELIEIIKKKKRIAVKELAEITFSSTSTLRRDLIFLENQGLIKRKHGYVTLSSMNTIELSHQIREGESTRQSLVSLKTLFGLVCVSIWIPVRLSTNSVPIFLNLII